MTTQRTDLNQPRRFGRARTAGVVTAGLIALLSVGLLVAAGAGLWGDSVEDRDGYISSGYERYSSQTRAITTENLDMDLDGPAGLLDEDVYGSLRIQVAPRSEQPVFVGIARTRDVDAYLRGSAHDVIRDVDFSPFRVDYDRRAGKRRPEAPATKDFWAASSEGRGTQALTWDVADGDWSVVVMNADGSPGVDARIDAGVKLPWLTALGWSLLGAAILGLVLAGLITMLTIRSARPAAQRAPVAA
jgi:hypothetical protein